MFTSARFENYFEGQDLTVEISGAPVFDDLSIQVWAGEDEGNYDMTVNGTPRFTEFSFNLGGDRFIEKAYLTFNGGYFDDDPRLALCELNDYFICFGGVESYTGQSDWAYDGDAYPWRISGVSGDSCDLNEDGAVNISDVTTLLNALSGSAAIPSGFDLNRDGKVNISDVTTLLNVLSGSAGGTSPASEDTLTIARGAFKSITGFDLPALPGAVIIGSSDVRPGQHTTICFDITGDAETMARINEALQAQIGYAPDNSDENGSSWSIEPIFDGVHYAGQIWTILDTTSSSEHSFVYVNYNVGQIKESYATGRQNFYTVSGILLPMLAGVEADEFPYVEGTKEYCFDLISGGNMYSVFNTLKNFFEGTMTGWSYRIENVGFNTDIQYTSAAGWIQLYWDSDNSAVYINARMN